MPIWISSILWFIILGFLPGFVLMGIFRPKAINWVKGILCIVGLSLMFDMAVGFAVNYIAPKFGVVPFDKCTLASVWGILSLILLPLVLVFFNRLVKPYRRDTDWWVVLAIYAVSVGLIYQSSLLTSNLIGNDIHLEYFYAQQPVLNGFYDMSVPVGINVCMPLTILIPMYSVLSGLPVMWVFKIIQPLVLAVLPIILYQIYKSQTNRTVGMLAVLFFVTLPFFTMDVAQLIRQQYSMIFFGLVILILLNRTMSSWSKIILGSIFGVGVEISHYGLGIGFMFYMAIGVVGYAILKTKLIQRLWGAINGNRVPVDIMSGNTLLVWLAITIVSVGAGSIYYFSVGSGVVFLYTMKIPFDIISRAINNVVTSDTVTQTFQLSNQWQQYYNMAFKDPLLQTAIGIDFGVASIWGKVWRILQYIVEICLITGLVKLIIRPMKGLKTEFLVFIITSFFVIIGMYVLPTKGFGLGVSRVFMITLMFLCPFFVIGVGTITQGIAKLFSVPWNSKCLSAAVLVILIPYFAFNSGLVFELTKSTKTDSIDIPFSVSLSGYRLDMASYYSDKDIEAMVWVKDKITKDFRLFGDYHTGLLLIQYRYDDYYDIYADIKEFCEYGKGYVFLRKCDVESQMLTSATGYGCRKSVPWLVYGGECQPMADILSKGVVVFDNGARIIKVDQ